MIKIAPLLAIVIVVSSIECRRPHIDFSSKENISFDNRKNDIYKDCGKLFKLNFKNLIFFKGSDTGSINKITITGCQQAPCIFIKGNNYTLDLEFTSSKFY